ncbi:MAG: hypothetical protein OCC49_13455 [Fibrobacterales bacterium]
MKDILSGRSDEDVLQNRNVSPDRLLVEIPIIGLTAFAMNIEDMPFRILSVKLKVFDSFGILLEPVVGVGQKIYGTTAGLFYCNPEKAFSSWIFASKYVFYTFENIGNVHEFFFDIDKYAYINENFNLRAGGSLGWGMNEYNYNDRDGVEWNVGPMAKIHFDFGFHL